MAHSGDSPGSLADALARARAELAGASDTVALDAEVLLSHLIGRDRAFLRAWPEQALTRAQSDAYQRLITLRREGWPIAYLTGEREFWSRSFTVAPGVLIPRCETELLIEIALDLLPASERVAVLDLGTGCGIIAVTLAAERPNASVMAIDASPEALRMTRDNASRHGVKNLCLARGNWCEPLSQAARFDLIISNPPYIAEGDPHLARGDLRYEPAAALASGPDGFDALRAIVDAARLHLQPDGVLLLEHGYDQAGVLANLLEMNGYRHITHYRDLQGHRRATMARYVDIPNVTGLRT